MTWRKPTEGEIIAVALILIALIAVGVVAWNAFNDSRTKGTLEKNKATVTEEQKDLGEQLTRREVDTVRHESTITIKTEKASARLDVVPVGSQLGPLLDDLCGMPLHVGDPACASRVRDPGDGQEEVPSGSVADE